MTKPVRDVTLREGPYDMVRLPLRASKHRTIHLADGSSYFRMDMSHQIHPDGTESQCYLWTDYWATLLAKEKTDG